MLSMTVDVSETFVIGGPENIDLEPLPHLHEAIQEAGVLYDAVQGAYGAQIASGVDATEVRRMFAGYTPTMTPEGHARLQADCGVDGHHTIEIFQDADGGPWVVTTSMLR